jgi:hypothetical protein
MVYLYAALGAVMLTGIMAIFEMGLSLTGQSLLPAPFDVYLETTQGEKARRLDEDLLKILTNPDDVSRGLSGLALCDAIEQADSPHQYSFVPIPSGESPWEEGCQFATSYEASGETIAHRIFVIPPESGLASSLPYGLFSCTSTRESYQCSFESSKAES